jgi:hypothetical protein
MLQGNAETKTCLCRVPLCQKGSRNFYFSNLLCLFLVKQLGAPKGTQIEDYQDRQVSESFHKKTKKAKNPSFIK